MWCTQAARVLRDKRPPAADLPKALPPPAALAAACWPCCAMRSPPHRAGSSCRVTPAADLPEAVSLRGGSLVIVNLQRTPLDGLAAVRVFSE